MSHTHTGSHSAPSPAMLARTAAAALALADKRKKSIKAIKAKVRQLGLDDASYRAMLQAHTGRASCKDCTLPELDRVCHYLTTQGASNPKAPSRPGKTLAAERVPLRGQVDKLMVDLSQKTSITKPLAYVNAILVKNHWCSDLDMASPEILRKLVGALSRTLNGRVAGTSQASRSQAAHTRR